MEYSWPEDEDNEMIMIKIDFVAFAGKFKTTIHTSNTLQRTVVNVNKNTTVIRKKIKLVNKKESN